MKEDVKAIHPMVSVPDAILSVLRSTALKIIGEGSGTEVIPVDWKLLMGRRLAHDVDMPAPGYPAYNASVMDGYAISSKDKIYLDGISWTHFVVDKVFAGEEVKQKTTNENLSTIPLAYYITTGAVVPDSCDCVVPIEDCYISDNSRNIMVKSTTTIQSGKWIRPIGFDIPSETKVLHRGHILDSSAIGLLLQCGIQQVEVQRKTRVGVMSTGNELLQSLDAGDVKKGMIPDVNRPMLLSRLTEFESCTPVDLGSQRDDCVASIVTALECGLKDQECDVIITTGGISMGESDLMEQVLVQKMGGELHFGRLHMKPGKPSTFITLHFAGRTRLFFALPGNPVSALVCTELLVRPCLQIMRDELILPLDSSDLLDDRLQAMVQNAWVHSERDAVLSHDIKLDVERPEYHRVTLKTVSGDIKRFTATSTGVQQSSRLLSMRDAEGLLVLPQANENRSVARKGETFTVLLFNGKEGVSVRNSRHMNRPAKKSIRISLVYIHDRIDIGSEPVTKLEELGHRIKGALTSVNAYEVNIVSSKLYAGLAEGLFDGCIHENNDEKSEINLYILVSKISFQLQIEIAATIRQRLAKIAESIAIIARQGVAAEHPPSTIYEVVVGYLSNSAGSMLILLPEEGLQGALSTVQDLIKHSLRVRCGKL
jgi:molybdenum cofactor synthesis domain-containing protein